MENLKLIDKCDSIVIIWYTLINDKNFFVFESYVQPYNTSKLLVQWVLLEIHLIILVDENGFTVYYQNSISFLKIVQQINGDTIIYQTNYIDVTKRMSNYLQVISMQ